MENIGKLNEKDAELFNQYLTKIHENYYTHSSEEEDDDQDYLLSDAVDNLITNNYSQESENFIISLLNHNNMSEVIRILIDKIDINYFDHIIPKLCDIYGSKEISIHTYKIITLNNVDKIYKATFFNVLETFYDEGYEHLTSDLWDFFYDHVNKEYVYKSFVNSCLKSNVDYFHYVINNRDIICDQSDCLKILSIVDNFEIVQTLLNKTPELQITENNIYNLITKFSQNIDAINFLKQYSKSKNIELDYEHIFDLLASNEYMSVIFNLAYNNRDDLIQQYVPKINKAIELPEKYYDVVRDLSLNNRLSTIKILFQIFLNNVNPNKNRKINELIENIKFDFVINGKQKDFPKIQEILMQ
ncbi:hypothetical protein Catovirus_1_887 [Catovirus CTV1]|uniref:Uncharacterized protein n=1 Tax=Catovirus CTV1 TaxID=1977631 RepID=A0A1V0SAU5_9VIRU|nr:hypothetical protein Catovirus_1_887 [Catovirus CTV1]